MYTMYSTNCNLIYFYRRWSMEKFKLPNINEEKTLLKTIRIKQTNMEKLEELAKKTGLSINRLINECIEYALINLDDSNLK